MDVARTAVLYSDWDEGVPGMTLSRFCASGLEAVNLAAMKVRSDEARADQPCDRPGFNWPGGDSRDPRQSDTWTMAPNVLRRKTHGNYPAPEWTSY